VTNPFLKWAGGKRWLASSSLLPIPDQFERYLEPFVGGGAVFFQLSPDQSILSDINPELINLYRVIRDTPEALETLMVEHQAKHSRDHYYQIRAEVPAGTIEQAARTLYLNRTCWNGLYRVNLQGEFNVPIGTKTTVIMEGESFSALSDALQGAKILCQDFEATLASAEDGDFVFVDPPYTVKHNLNGFLKYNEKIFGWSDQVRLHDAVVAAADRGASVVVTNADHESVRELYSDFTYRQLGRTSVLAGDPSKRGKTSEAMFLANVG
jgi:DNA adenine methylase